eukprot:10107171-Lingulodinium_polyedra.AAC.1
MASCASRRRFSRAVQPRGIMLEQGDRGQEPRRAFAMEFAVSIWAGFQQRARDAQGISVNKRGARAERQRQ